MVISLYQPRYLFTQIIVNTYDDDDDQYDDDVDDNYDEGEYDDDKDEHYRYNTSFREEVNLHLF